MVTHWLKEHCTSWRPRWVQLALVVSCYVSLTWALEMPASGVTRTSASLESDASLGAARGTLSGRGLASVLPLGSVVEGGALGRGEGSSAGDAGDEFSALEHRAVRVELATDNASEAGPPSLLEEGQQQQRLQQPVQSSGLQLVSATAQAVDLPAHPASADSRTLLRSEPRGEPTVAERRAASHLLQESLPAKGPGHDVEALKGTAVNGSASERSALAAVSEPPGMPKLQHSLGPLAPTHRGAGHVLVANTIKSAAVASNIFVQLAPWRSVRSMAKRGSVGSVDPGTYVSLTACGLHWTTYGFLCFLITAEPGTLVIMYANAGGAIMGAYYIRVFKAICDNDSCLHRLRVYLIVFATLVFCEACAAWFRTPEQVRHIVGLVSTGMSICLAASPLLTLGTVLRTRSVGSMPADLVLVCCCSALLWTIVGLELDDHFVVVTNFSALCFALVSLSVLVRFHPVTSRMASCCFNLGDDGNPDIRKLLVEPREMEDVGTAGYESGHYYEQQLD